MGVLCSILSPTLSTNDDDDESHQEQRLAVCHVAAQGCAKIHSAWAALLGRPPPAPQLGDMPPPPSSPPPPSPPSQSTSW